MSDEHGVSDNLSEGLLKSLQALEGGELSVPFQSKCISLGDAKDSPVVQEGCTAKSGDPKEDSGLSKLPGSNGSILEPS